MPKVEEAKQLVAQSQADQSGSTPAPSADLGANEWLVEEMREQYDKDPGSVGPQWAAFFGGSSNGSSNGTDAKATTATVTSTPQASKGPAKAPARATPAPKQDPAPAAEQQPAPAAKQESGSRPTAKPRPASEAAEPAKGTTKPVAKDATPAAPAAASDEPTYTTLRGIPAATAKNMDLSLTVPTATSIRTLPVKLLWDNRTVINNHLARARGGKVSFTHLIGYALVKALRSMPEMNNHFAEVDGKPTMVTPAHINLGLAIDQQKQDGTRQLVVPSIKGCETMDFAGFWTAYEEVIRRARDNKLTMDDYSGTTISLTNLGGLGTSHSVPRLMPGQAVIVGVGAMEYPAEWQGASDEALNRNGVSKVMTLTSTYDHRVIQGAQSGEFLRRVHQLLLGEDDFYDDIFRSLRIPYEPIRWAKDIVASHDDDIVKQARILELIHAYRVRGHMMADTDPLEYRQRSHPDLEVESHGLTLWDLDREFATGCFGGECRRFMKLRNILGILRDSYCRTTGIEYMHILDPEQRKWIQERVERPHTKPPREEQLRILLKLNQAEAFETFLQTKFVGQKRFSLEGGETTIPLIDEICEAAAEQGLDEVAIGMAHRGRLNVLANIVGKKYSQIFREFEGNIDPRTVQGSGRREVPPRRRGRVPVRPRATRIKVSVAANPSHLEAVDPVLEGIARAKQDVLNKGADVPRPAAARPRRRGLRRPGRGRRDAQPLAAARLPHRRHHPRRRQQPGRLHHLARLVALVALLHRRGPDGAGADLPRQRRRPGGVHPRRPARLRVPPGVQQGRRHRPRLLPPPRSQRGRRPVVHPAADVRPDRAEALGAQALHRVPHRSWRHHRRGGRAGPQGLPAAARARLHRGARGQQRAAVGVDHRPGLPRQAAPASSAPPCPRRSSSGSPTPTSRRPRASPSTPR